MAPELVRYVSADEDSARWIGFPFRDGDIVISARSKTGTTWVQMICALMIFQVPELPAPLGRYSPWLDRVIYPRAEVYARLAGQEHRRFIKTHTPLDGIPLDPRATYIVTARHPLDMAVSLYHQMGNINRSWQRQRDGRPAPPEPEPERKPLRDWLLDWIGNDAGPREDMDSLPGVMWHLSDAWARRGEPNVLLIRYEDLCADLPGHMRWLAGRLGITVPEQAWPGLIRAATFDHMQANASRSSVPAGSSRAASPSSAGAGPAPDARSSPMTRSPTTTRGQFSWHHAACSPGFIHQAIPARPDPFSPPRRLLVRARSQRQCCPIRNARVAAMS